MPGVAGKHGGRWATGLLVLLGLGLACDSQLGERVFPSDRDEAARGSGPWNGYAAAFTFSSDDNNDDNLVWADVCRANGVRFTMFVVPRWVDRGGKLRLAELRALDADGFEIAGHGLTHAYLTVLDDASLIREMRDCRDTLCVMLARRGYACRTFAYPYHAHDARVMACAETLFVAARDGGLSSQGHPGFSEGVATWDSVSLYEVPLLLTVRRLVGDNEFSESETRQAVLDRAGDWREHHRWVNIYAHTLNDCDAAHLGWILDELIAAGDIWVAPFGDVADYYRRCRSGWIGEQAHRADRR